VSTALLLILVTIAAAAWTPAPANAEGETPVDLTALGGASDGTDASALQVHGFAVLDYSYDLKTHDNSANTSALALSLFRPTRNHRLNLFGQLTAHPPEEEPFVSGSDATASLRFAPADESDAAAAAAGSIETEIDNMLVTWTVSPRAGLDATFGKFDSPLAVERDDAPLNYQATTSFLLDFARPVKFTGAMLHEAFSPHLEAAAIVANGEDVTPDNNQAKTGALYGRYSPTLEAHLGLGVIAGDQETGLLRTTTVATLVAQPASSWVVGGEGVLGGQDRPEGVAGRDTWSGALAFIHHRFPAGGGHWAGTVRAEVLDDPDGLRTGIAQTLSSFTLSPQYLLGGGAYGIFHYLEGTTLPLAQVSVRADLRWDHSNHPVFAGSGDAVAPDRYTADLQLAYVF